MPKAAAVAAPAVTIEMLKLDDIAESNFNPRKTFEGIEDLAEDVKLRGVLQPVLVRPLCGKHELVFGARRYRAAKLAGLDVIPAMVRELSDVEALEIALIENSKRSDVHPLEEADAYRALHEKYGYDVDYIAAKVGKSRAAVYARLKLVELGEAGRKAFLEGKLNASTALLVARVPAENQDEATRQLCGNDWQGPPSFRQATQIVQRHYTQSLKEAPFSPKDAKLLPSAGACTACPKRSGTNPDLFGDIEGADVCTDRKCFKLKCDTYTEKRLAEAREKGQEVLEEKGIFQYGSSLSRQAGNEYEDLENFAYAPYKGEDPDEEPEERRYRDLVGKGAPVVLAKDLNGRVHELIRRTDLKIALEQAGHKEYVENLVEGGGGDDYEERRKKDEAARKLREKTAARALDQLSEKLGKKTPDAKWWRMFVRLMRPTIDDEKVSSASEEQLRAIAFREALHGAGASHVWQGYTKTLKDFCADHRVDLKAIEKELKVEAKSKAPKSKPAAKKGRAA